MLLREILRELKYYQDQSLTTQVVHEQGQQLLIFPRYQQADL